MIAPHSISDLPECTNKAGLLGYDDAEVVSANLVDSLIQPESQEERQ